jgi:acetolactate decarboxylase
LKLQEIYKLDSLALKGELSACDLDKLKGMEGYFTDTLFTTHTNANFIGTEITDFKYNPVLKSDYIKADILNKNIK